MKTRTVVLLSCAGAAVAAAAVGGFVWSRGSEGARPAFRTGLVERGPVQEVVEASGAVRPLVEVRVGTQVSGVVDQIWKDWNARVTAGEAIATLDSRRLVAQVHMEEANLGRARREVERAEATRWRAERELERRRALAANRTASRAELDQAEAEAREAQAAVAVAAAVVEQAQAQLDSDRVNLEYATIRAPIDGVVISRDVDVGQTVAASLQAPTLFVIAGDLAHVQVEVSVPEADVGRVHDGQRATFSVDAHPDRQLDGIVSQVRLGATTVQNVVTYTVLVDALNPDGLLLPGMTATVRIELARSAPTALRVPAGATRFSPPGAPADPAEGEAVWVPGADGAPRRVPVRLGVSDGAMVELEPIEAGALGPGTPVLLGVKVEEEAGARNPFMPQLPRRGSGAGTSRP